MARDSLLPWVDEAMSDKETLYDRDIREPLFEFLEDTFGKVRILEEKRTGMLLRHPEEVV